MKEIRVKFLGEDVERVFYERDAQEQGAGQVEIVTAGTARLVYINGHRVRNVLDIELPIAQGDFGPQIVLRLHADKIVQRTVSGEEFKRLKDG